MIISNFFLLRVETNTFGDGFVAFRAPHVEGHLKANGENALVHFVGALSEGAFAPLVRVERTTIWRPIWGIIKVIRPSSLCASAVRGKREL